MKPLRCLSGFGSELRSCGAISVLLYAVHPSAASVANQESRPCDPHAQGEGVLCDHARARLQGFGKPPIPRADRLSCWEGWLGQWSGVAVVVVSGSGSGSGEWSTPE